MLGPQGESSLQNAVALDAFGMGMGAHSRAQRLVSISAPFPIVLQALQAHIWRTVRPAGISSWKIRVLLSDPAIDSEAGSLEFGTAPPSSSSAGGSNGGVAAPTSAPSPSAHGLAEAAAATVSGGGASSSSAESIAQTSSAESIAPASSTEDSAAGTRSGEEEFVFWGTHLELQQVLLALLALEGATFEGDGSGGRGASSGWYPADGRIRFRRMDSRGASTGWWQLGLPGQQWEQQQKPEPWYELWVGAAAAPSQLQLVGQQEQAESRVVALSRQQL